MIKCELQVLSNGMTVALTAMSVAEHGKVPMAAAVALCHAAATGFPEFAPICTLFIDRLRDAHGLHHKVQEAGRNLRDQVCATMAFTPVDLHRVDIHG